MSDDLETLTTEELREIVRELRGLIADLTATCERAWYYLNRLGESGPGPSIVPGPGPDEPE